MREIKFKGYCDRDSEWRYGFYLTDGNNHEILTKIVDSRSGEVCMYGSQVDPDTVSQFTGIKDAEGVDIYEGDILDCGREGVGAVKFSDGAWTCLGELLCWFDCDPSILKIVGNIHENPEFIN